MLRSERSLTSRTRFQVMPCGSSPSVVAVVEVVVHHGGQQVVGGGHGVQVAGEVEVQILERDDLAVPAAGRAALDPEGRAHGGLADGDRGLTTDAGQGLAESDRRGRLPLPERGRRDGGHDHVVGPGPVGQRGDRVEAHLGDVGAVGLEQLGTDPHLCGDLGDREERGAAGDLDGRGERHRYGSCQTAPDRGPAAGNVTTGPTLGPAAGNSGPRGSVRRAPPGGRAA